MCPTLEAEGREESGNWPCGRGHAEGVLVAGREDTTMPDAELSSGPQAALTWICVGRLSENSSGLADALGLLVESESHPATPHPRWLGCEAARAGKGKCLALQPRLGMQDGI